MSPSVTLCLETSKSPETELLSSIVCMFILLQAKIPSARSLDDIAMDLTEMGTPKVSKLATLEVKNQFIMASNGSLISSGNLSCF